MEVLQTWIVPGSTYWCVHVPLSKLFQTPEGSSALLCDAANKVLSTLPGAVLGTSEHLVRGISKGLLALQV